MVERLKTMPEEPLKIACCFIFNNHGEVLLLQRHTDALGGGLWATPGGKQELREDPAATVIREVSEETGLKIANVGYLGMHVLIMPHGTVHMRSYRAVVKSGQRILINPEEHQAYAWQHPSKLLTAERLIWGLPTTLSDFNLAGPLRVDPTLVDGSQAILAETAP